MRRRTNTPVMVQLKELDLEIILDKEGIPCTANVDEWV
jgi:hypothetical protein